MICSDPLLPGDGGGVNGDDDIEVSGIVPVPLQLSVSAHIITAGCVTAAHIQEDGHFNFIDMRSSKPPLASVIAGRVELGRG